MTAHPCAHRSLLLNRPTRTRAPRAERSPSVAPPAAGAPRPADDDGPDDRVDTDRSACVLLTVSEVGAAMRQTVTDNPADPYGVAGAQGCEFNTGGSAFTNVVLFPANAAFYYDSIHTTVEPNGVQPVPGLGDRAFSYAGENGPGLVVARGDKLFVVEFNGIGSGPTEKASLLVLAQDAADRVH